MKNVAIIGGGASGVFCSILLGETKNIAIDLYEKSNELLKKVKISGGGRCNVTHHYSSPAQFSKNYPRGGKWMKANLNRFSPNDMRLWLENRGVQLKTEADGRVFPISNDSQTIIDCFQKELETSSVCIKMNTTIEAIQYDKISQKYRLQNKEYDVVIIATGGAVKLRELDCIVAMRHEVIAPVPSLFTFKINDKSLHELMGLSVPHIKIKIIGTKYVEEGPVLITHWGLSGPAVLKLSSWAAFELNKCKYSFQIGVNWTGIDNEEKVLEAISTIQSLSSKSKIINQKLYPIPQRLWCYILAHASIDLSQKWIELSKKEKHKLAQTLTHHVFEINGKTTFKEEFVTAGGISLHELHPASYESKHNKNLYFIGEVVNADALTGGFNFQHAWTSAYVCATEVKQSLLL